MLKGVFSLDNPVMRFLSRVADIMILNLLFLLCSIPVVTIGASLSALYYCLFKIKEEEEGYLVRKFFHSFKDNLKQATLMWLIFLAFFLLLFLEFLMYRNVEGTSGSVVRSIVLIGLIFWYLICTYAFALQSKFYNSIGNTLRNAVLLMFANGPRSIAIIGLTAAAIAFTLMQKEIIVIWNLLLVWILFGFSGIATINVQFLFPIIQKLMPEEKKEEVTPDNAFSVDENADLSTLGYGPAGEAADTKEIAAEAPDKPADVKNAAETVPDEPTDTNGAPADAPDRPNDMNGAPAAPPDRDDAPMG